MRPILLRVLFAAVTSAWLVGCAGTSVSRIEGPSVPSDVPQDLVNKFEVKDMGTPQATPSPAAEPGKTKTAPAKKAPVAKGAKTKGPYVVPNRRPAVDPIWLGEKQTFEITYFGVKAGDFTLEALPYKEVNGRKSYHIKGHAESSAVFSLFYKIDDTVQTFIDYEGLFSHRFELNLNESKQTRISIELNDSEKEETYYWNRWNHYKKGYIETKESKPIPPFSQDSVSALFYVRTLPLPDGAEVTFPVVSEGKAWEAVVKVVGREELKSPMGRVRVIKLKPETKYQGILQKRGDSFIWVTDDDRRIVVQLEAKVRIGTVMAVLKKFEPGVRP